MAKHTKIGFQQTNGTITLLELCSDSGNLEVTGKVLNTLYTNLSSVNTLIQEGANNIDISSITNIDNHIWGVHGTNFSDYGYQILDSPSQIQEYHSLDYFYFYYFSEVHNKWFVSSNDNQIWRELSSEL